MNTAVRDFEREQERWDLELGEQVADALAHGEQGEVRWFITVAWPYLRETA